MKHLTAIMIGLVSFTTPPITQAARISEPSTLFYGRVYQRVGDWEFNATEGNLEWTIENLSLPGHQYQLSTTLRPLGGGLYSYLLRIPHEVLAYDLEVATNTVPLTSGGFSFRHLRITVNDHPAFVQVPAAETFSARQNTRAASYHIDLEVPNLSPDSDGDGLPDWWEDLHGTDRWDSFDGPSVFEANPSSDVASPDEEEPMTFAVWRQQHFPEDTRPLEIIASEDPDADGVANVLEYAFDTNPRDGSESRLSLPHAQTRDGKFVLEYHQRADARDLNYSIEISQDLIHWTAAAAGIETSSQPAANPALSLVTVQAGPELETQSQVYLRVVVSRRPLSF